MNDAVSIYHVIGTAAAQFSTHQEIADLLGVSLDEFTGLLSTDEAAAAEYREGFARAKQSLRRAQLKLAETSAPVAIFLGKQYLGQRDEVFA